MGLNPDETIWQYLRANGLAFSVFDSCDAIVDACCAAWNLRQRSQNRHLNPLARLSTGQVKGPLV